LGRITSHPSGNFGPRRHGGLPDMVVLHHTAMQSNEAALERLCDPKAEVSAHYLISEQGEVAQLVEEEMRAWHAGAGRWGNVRDVNSHSIGIELANPGPLGDHPPFAAPQMQALEALLGDILTRWSIPPERVIAHSDMAPERKFDPGPAFDWHRLARAGLSVWPEPGAVGDFSTDAARFGYAAPDGVTDPDQVILAAFRLRFRPGQSGPLDDIDRALIHDLATRFGVDLTIGAA
jgi:N-acetylmuramoyl-L-alanine amidase